MSQSEILKLLMDYFPTAVNTGRSLVFISEDWRIELIERKNPFFGQNITNTPIIRVKVFKKALNGEFLAGHYEDFQILSINDLALQIERYIQNAVGTNIRENA
ncbi:MAG TPA: hypothetical protein PK052_01385 [Anaerohalosphaeraceae bacterium]|nr:hypothetical protein [Phycisphaerae bacterium]HOK94679.1 hypothetical protein [Anaerohalosphaeraceae bacterium]HOL30609.1 hypothetical protein [Anaerohalosphaeraceae bacterium]HOM75274.1 hypothetical protein [Anaerohalosphaeraceae bacterium]HPC63126.1 hypothetical protein [Anaerohalosphaeraceae bacterium]